jgi:glycosyltransferase involved in cell wall biosynthesis
MECPHVSGLARASERMTRRILIVVNVDWFFASHRLPIAEAAVMCGSEVHVAMELTQSPVHFETLGLIVHDVPFRRNSTKVRDTIRTMLVLWRVMRQVNPDIVHLVTIKPILLAGVLARLLRIRGMVAAISGLGTVYVATGWRAALRRRLVNAWYRRALGHRNQMVIFQNREDEAQLRQCVVFGQHASIIIPGSGVNLERYGYTPLPNAIPVMLFAARLLVDKGIKEFVAAAGILRDRGWTDDMVRFEIAGEPDLSNPGSISPDELRLWTTAGTVTHLGHQNDMPRIISLSCAVILPSYYGEGVPKILIEAAACGRAVITTDHPGCRDAIEPDVTGLLIPVRNPTALADAMETLLRNPARFVTMGQAGRTRAETLFDVREVVATHLRIYDQLVPGS